MKLSQDTIAILKNFAGINPNLVITPGNVLKTITEAKSVLGTATIAESFDKTLGIYDLNEFVAALALVSDPDITVEDSVVVITNGTTTVKFRLADPEILTKPTKDVRLPSADIKVTVTADAIAKVSKAAATLGHANISVTSTESGSVQLSVVDLKNSAANSYTLDLGVKAPGKFNVDFLLTNLRFIPGDYVLEVSSKGVSKWTAVSGSLSYLVALEKSSSFAL